MIAMAAGPLALAPALGALGALFLLFALRLSRSAAFRRLPPAIAGHVEARTPKPHRQDRHGWLRAASLVESRRVRRRLRAIDDEVPQLLDLLAASSSAGLSAQLALRRSLEALGGPLADVLGAAVRDADLGERWRDALETAAGGIGLRDLTRTVAVLTRTERLGTSLAEATSELATGVRESRRLARTERARTAPVKMLFPLVFLVLPAFLLLTVVPVLLTTLQSIR